MVRVVKKDHTKEPFNIQKVVIAVNKSANRVLYNFTEDELKSICNHVEGYIRYLSSSISVTRQSAAPFAN